MKFPLKFDLAIEETSIDVHLYPDAFLDISKMVYHIRNISIRNSIKVLPDLSVRKRKEEWIHTDSLKSSRLSAAIGAAIDKLKTRRRANVRPSNIKGN